MKDVSSPDQELPEVMSGVLLTGHGGFDKLEYRHDLPVPRIGRDEVLIRVAAAGVNNTDINTRTGWYSKKVTTGTTAGGASGFEHVDDGDATWTGASMVFPRIQGADCCGYIVAVGDAVDASRIGERVIVQVSLRHYVDGRPWEAWCLGSECDGAFAEYAKVPSAEAHRVESDWSDAELASLPTAYATAENMLHRARVTAGDRVLITGASGGVGSAAVQLAKRRGAFITAVVSRTKAEDVMAVGADRAVFREENLLAALGAESHDVVIDVAGGPSFPDLLTTLARGGRYAVAGAIAGPMVELDLRTLYLKDLSFFGCTFQEDVVFRNLVGYVERGEIRPFIGSVYPLSEIIEAQKEFLSKRTSGKIVLLVTPEENRRTA
ncbi:alcohol dehydrogenase family protein [Microbacterium sp. A196]|uniref:alcohol dehydrogenase family protein n=1 Tax=Microbacterium sp. A196 TaxID=3457320 RepID=UPI003FD50130